MTTANLPTRIAQFSDGNDVFDVTVIESANPRRVCIFSVGAGGNPTRHLSILQAVAALGCAVIAPHFDMLASSIPTKAELEKRIRRLEVSAKEYLQGDRPLVGIGHSIGTVVLLALAGAKAWTLAGDQVTSEFKWKFSRLALLAPATDFFRHPDALKSVDAPIRIWVGGKDSITPPSQAQFLKTQLESKVPIEIYIDELAGHFSFMDTLPPNRSDSHPNRAAYLQSVASEVSRFVTS